MEACTLIVGGERLCIRKCYLGRPPAILDQNRSLMLMPSLRNTWLALILISLSCGQSLAQDFSEVEIRTTLVADGVYALQGAGGNLGLVVTEDGAFLIDDQYAPLTDRILAAVAEVTDQPVRFVLNTHWHGDHTGGNENMSEAGALIVAHDNVRKRLQEGQLIEFFNSEVAAAPDAALPVVTFSETITFHLGGHTVYAEHVANAHTDGDSIVQLPEADVIHTGDLVFFGMYPFIDYSSGGSIGGMVRAVDRMLEMTGPETRIIAGHGGPVISPDQLMQYRSFLATVEERMRGLIAEGKTLGEVLEANPLADFEEDWGGGFINSERWIGLLYSGMMQQ